MFVDISGLCARSVFDARASSAYSVGLGAFFHRNNPENCHDPVQAIPYLVQQCPESARVADAHGRLPLHCLCANKMIGDEREFLGLIQCLVEQYPEALTSSDDSGDLPLHDIIF